MMISHARLLLPTQQRLSSLLWGGSISDSWTHGSFDAPSMAPEMRIEQMRSRTRRSSRLQVAASKSKRRIEGLEFSSTRREGPTSSRGDVSSGASRGRTTASPIDAERIEKLNELLREVSETVIRTGPRGIVRFVQGAQAVASVGSEWLLKQVQIQPPGPREMRLLFEQLGATYIKLGQFIASAPTLFPADYVAEFQKCLDKTPPVPFPEIKAVILEDLGRPLEEVFEFFDEKPLATASIAQVHAARLIGSGKDVVVKVLKPGVKDTLTTDLDFLYLSARVLEFLNPDLSRTSLVGIISDIRSSMMEEVDFQREALNIEQFRSYLQLAGLGAQATAPVVFYHCSSRRVLTMERLYGVPLTDLESIRSIVANPEATLISALNVWFGSLLASESFHADVHAGNLLVLRDGRVGFIDFGIVGRIAPSTWNAISSFLTSLATSDYSQMAVALSQMGATGDSVDLDAFSRDLESIFNKVQDLDPEILITTSRGPGQSGTRVAAQLAVDDQQVNALLLEIIQVSDGYGLRFPREFGLLLKQLLYFDRYTRLLAPSLNVLEDERVKIRPVETKQRYPPYAL